MLVWSGVIHLLLWDQGYRSIATIGPLFLAQGVGCIVLGVVVVIFRRLALLLAGAVALAATAVGLLVSVHVGLLGFRESLAVPYATLSLLVEFVGAALLLAGAVLLAVSPTAGAVGQPVDRGAKQRDPDEPGNPSHAHFRI
jgi:hypothetical protein